MLKFFPSLLLLILLLGLCACELGGKSASSALQEVATALEKNDASAFVAQFDLKACAANEIKNITEANEALSTLDQLGRRLGLGGMEDLLGNVFDVERELRQDFARKVSTGELALTCRKQQKPGCPWVPESLRRAEVEKISETAAVARVVTPEKLTTWLALVKEGELGGLWVGLCSRRRLRPMPRASWPRQGSLNPSPKRSKSLWSFS